MKQNKRSTAKNLLATVLMIGTVAGGFYGFTQTAIAAENSKVITLPTSYPAVPVISMEVGEWTPGPRELTEQPDYTLVDNDLPYYQGQYPTVHDISREEAAAIGVKGLEDVFGIDLAGKEIEMAYNRANNGLRAYWQGEYWYNGKKQPDDLYVGLYFFSVDSITGELMSVQYTRVLDENVNTGFDMALNESGGGTYRALAEKEALEHGAIKDAVKEISDVGQGSSNNDPTINLNLTGTSGERAQIQLSRYDNALLAITFDAGVREMDVSERNAEEFMKRAEAYYAANPGATSYDE